MKIVKQKANSTNNTYNVNTGMNPVKRILILAANPITTPRLRLDKEVSEIEEGIKLAKHGNQFLIQQKWAVRRRDFQKALLDYEPHIVHFTGHGKEDGLLVENEIGTAVRFSADALSELFKLCSDHVECVILSACYSVPQAAAINRHINYVIGMRRAIEDNAAIEFSVGFYNALGSGRSIEDAFAFGRAAVLAEFPDLPQHLIPILKIKKKSKPNKPPTIITDMVEIKIRIETTGDVFDARVPVDTRTSSVKSQLVNELKLPKTFEDGQPIFYYLLSKTRNQPLDDDKTLGENGVRDNEVFVFYIIED